MYLCVTKGAAEWMISKPKLLDVLHNSLERLIEREVKVGGFIFAEGQFRLAINTEHTIICIWNVDYLSGTGEESMGFAKISGELSLLDYPLFSREAFERAVYLINQRLHGLLIEGSFLHRKHAGNIHTLLAGRGSEARQFSLGYFDMILGTSIDYRAIIIAGPSDRFAFVVNFIESESKKLDHLISESNKIIFSHHDYEIDDTDFLSDLRVELRLYFSDGGNLFNGTIPNSEFKFAGNFIQAEAAYRTYGYSYEKWIESGSPLNKDQRNVLISETLNIHPIRIVGPAGSGKTLLMQLLAGKKLIECMSDDSKRAIYIIHNEAMRNKVMQNIQVLFPETDLSLYADRFIVTTLSEYCRSELQLGIDSILDKDASEAREFQVDTILEILADKRTSFSPDSRRSINFLNDFSDPGIIKSLAGLIMTEISVAIKGNGLQEDRNRYINSERYLSILHGKISVEERNFIFDVFEKYNNDIFYELGVMDPDDLAISLYGRLKTPLWTLQRRERGFDYIFVDEAQLFSENEKRILPLLSKNSNMSVPIAIALDEAQSLYGGSTAGYSALGIKDISNRTLKSIHRSSSDILKLAFFILQRSTNLFSIDFPDFTKNEFEVPESDTSKLRKPRIERESAESNSFSRFILRRVRELRKNDIRQIAIVCHSETYWNSLSDDLAASNLPFQVIKERGEKIRSDQPHVVLCRPAQIGGQEFEAVIIVGIESTAAFKDNAALASAIEQQMIRELYLSITRARYQVILALGKFSKEHDIIKQAVEAGYIVSN